MLQHDTSAFEQKIRDLRDRLQGKNDDLQRETDDRRRLGRAGDVNPTLIPFLRGEAAPALLVGDELDLPYGLEHTTPLLGIAVSVIFSVPLWSVLGFMVWAIFH